MKKKNQLPLPGRSIVLIFPRSSNNLFSGKRFATEILLKYLQSASWEVEQIHPPLLDRKSINITTYHKLVMLVYIMIKTLITWIESIRFIFSDKIIYINLSLSRLGILRDGFPLIIRGVMNYSSNGIVSFHGSNFLNWQANDFTSRLLKLVLSGSKYVTVLGPSHVEKLISLGISRDKIIVLDNTCLVPPLERDNIIDKHKNCLVYSEFDCRLKPIQIVYLSSLIESKGYIKLVEAIKLLPKRFKKLEFRYNIFICGQLRSDFENFVFPTLEESKVWLDNQIIEINDQFSHIHLEWINGISGQEKTELLHESHIFVLPTTYRVEAQPISILEAIATGCAVITTKVGEIPSTLDENTAVLLEDVSPESISFAILNLCYDIDFRSNLCVNALNLFNHRFSTQRHYENWNKILSSFDYSLET